MDHSLQHYRTYIGKSISALPTPSFVISLPTVKKNIAALHHDVENLGIGFRPHVKTLKTLEITRMMLGNGKYRSVVASTLSEIRGLLPLVDEGLLYECLYGLPICPGYLPELSRLRHAIRILLMIDNEQQIDALEAFANEATSPAAPWDIFIKLDVGSNRAGVAVKSPSLRRIVERAINSPIVSIYGFYCHAGHSYGHCNRESAEETLNNEISSVLAAASILPESRDVVVSIGATPTAHVVSSLKATLPPNIKLELHAGNFPCNDLQQVSTHLVSETDQAIRIAAEVCSLYPERNEALVNAGAIAISRETSGFEGFGHVVDRPQWSLVRLSQEHGILATQAQDNAVEKEFKVGDRVYLYCNHACITAAAFFVYYVTDENEMITDAWIPWKGW